MIRKYLVKGALIRGLLILAGALLFSPPRGCSQKYDFNPACDKAWQAVMMLQFGEARAILDREEVLNPTNLVPCYIGSYIDFLVLFTGEDRALFDKLKAGKTETLNKLETGDPSSPYYRFCIAETYIQWAFTRLKFREYTSAGIELARANVLLTENHALHPDFLPDLLGLGIMHSLNGVIPENYKWLGNLIGLEGDLEQGVNELEKIAGYAGPDPFIRSLKAPACIFAALIDASLRADKSAALSMIRRFDTEPGLMEYATSPLVIYAKSSIFLKTGHNEKALEILSGFTSRQDGYRMSFLDYLHGMALLNNLDPSSAASFRTFLSGFKGVNYIKSAWQKIAWASLIEGDTLSYRKNIGMALTQGNRDVDEDRQAYYEASSGRIPGIPLLKARLLYDGGYYNRALDVLLNQSLKEYIHDNTELAEYHYRLGRIYQSMRQDGRALQNYSLAVQQGRGLPQYFAAGAALQMGIIHEQNKRFVQADSCFRITLALDYREYKTSLNQKAKAGISRVKKSIP
jgi:hypothetical protein